MRMNAALVGVALVVLLAGCGDDDDTDADPTEDGSATVAATSAGQTPTSDPATAALFGEWRTVIAEGDNVTLRLREGRYTILRGPATGQGGMNARAGEAEFSGSDLCDGIGIYRWSIQDGALSFTSVGKDDCPGRSEVLDGITYRK